MKKTVLLSCLALTASVFADGDLVAAGQKMNGSSSQKMKDNSSMTSMVTLSSARPESDNGWYLFADALYWHVDVGSADWAAALNSTNNPDFNAYNRSLDYKWNWGFRAGIGVNMDHDMWDSSLSYTWLFADNSNSVGGDNLTVTDQYGYANATSTINTGSTKWNIHFSMFDWDLGRWHYVSKNLALRPHVGIKGGWIHQNVHTEFANPTALNGLESVGVFTHEKFENNYWGIGPSAGLNTMWVLGNAGSRMQHRFSLVGDVAGALMYGHFDVSNKQYILNTTGARVGSLNLHDLDRNLATAMLQGAMGLSWDTAFNSNKNHFTMKVTYELQYWFRQNQLARTTLSGTEVNVSRLSDDLSLQGLTVDFRFDF